MTAKKNEGIAGLKETQGGIRRDDRHVMGNREFDPITIDSKSAQTAIYMLQSPEPNVVLRAVAGLEAFGRKGRDNLLILSSLKILQYLIPLLLDENYIIKRFAQKLTGMLCSLDEFKEQILEVPNILELVVGVLEKETDVVLHEFAALILAHLSSSYLASAALLRLNNCIEVLFERITSPDPDVKKNCLEVMNHLLNDVTGVEAFLECKGFKMIYLLDLTISSYPVIQSLTLEVLKKLTAWCRDTRALYAFRDAGGVENILIILETEEWQDLHLQALQLLINIVDSPCLSDHLFQSGYLERINRLLENIRDKEILAKILGAFARISQTQKGRATFHMMEMESRFCKLLEDDSELIKEPACIGIANMSLYGLSLNEIMNNNPVPLLLEIITKTTYNPFLRTVGAYALNVLCNHTPEAVEALMNCKNFTKIYTIFNDSINTPVEVLKNILQMFIGISMIKEMREKLIDISFISALMNCIEATGETPMPDITVQIDALECLAAYMVDTAAITIFDSLNGTKLLYNLLISKSSPIKEWTSHLIVLASQNKSFVKNFILIKGLDRLLQEKSLVIAIPTWQKAIDAIFANHLPAKFAYTGRLDFQDITEDGFYICSSSRCRFVLLENCLANSISPICPVYVASFSDPKFNDSDISSRSEKTQPTFSDRTDTSTQKRSILASQTNSQPNTNQNQRKSIFLKESEAETAYTATESVAPAYSNNDFSIDMEDSSSEDYNSLYFDSDLSEYLETLKKRLEKEEINFGNIEWFCIHPKIVRERARIIAEFVAEEMSGSYPATYCRFYKEIQINELKCKLGTNILPLRYIRAGDYLERAMLFKVLADRVGFPCALVRGMYGRTWIEISIPVINVEDMVDISLKNYLSDTHTISHSHNSKDSKLSFDSSKSPCESISTLAIPEGCFWYPRIKMECFKAYPNYLLKPNAIVDLVEMPGRIIRLTSPEADRYRGTFFNPKLC